MPETNASNVYTGESWNTVKNINEVTLTGSIIQTYQPEGRDMVVLTMATNGGRGSHTNYPKITWYGDRARRVIEDLQMYTGEKPRVCIKGTIQTSRKGEGENRAYFQTVVGTEFSFAPKELEGKLNMDIGNRYIADENEVILAGQVVHTFHFKRRDAAEGDAPTGSILTIRTRINNWPNHPKVTLFRHLCEAAQRVQIGDMIAVSGIIQTNRSEYDGKRKYFETVVGTDLDWYQE